MRQITRDRWAAVFAAFEGSGLSAARFCQRRGVALSSFYAARRRMTAGAGPGGGRGDAAAGPAFVEALVAAGEGGSELIVECRGGRRVLVPRGFDELTLARVVVTLEHESLRGVGPAGACP